jgi:glycosyltransferase involved in cell wall biosynthesis
MRILFANHTGAWSGAEVSLMRVLAGVRGAHDVTVACPPGGPLAEAVDRAGVERLPLPAVDASLRVHPLQTPVGVGQLAAGGLALARASRRARPDVIHANTPRTGLTAAIARRWGGAPFVVRAHEHLPPSTVGRAVRAVLGRSAEAIVANSDYTAARLNEGLDRPVAVRVYNSIDHARFDPEVVGRVRLRDELGLERGVRLLGQVAQITPWKGQDTSIRMLAELRRQGIDAHLALVGQVAFGGRGVRYDNHAFLASLERLVGELELGGAVHFLGQREDVPEILSALDLSLLPSWEEPFGLAVVESMAMGTPPLVTSVGAGPELVEDGVSGRVLPPRQPRPWAAAARDLLEDPGALARAGAAGPPAAARFRDDVHAEEMLEIYSRAAGRPVARRAPGAVGVAGGREDPVEAAWRS